MTTIHKTLTIDNLEEIANAINEKLASNTYTFVACNEFFGFNPEVRTDQKLSKDALGIWQDEENDPPNYAGFNFNDSHGVWGLSTSQRDEKYDHEFNAPYVVIEHNQIKMTLRAPAGHKIYWTIAIQDKGVR